MDGEVNIHYEDGPWPFTSPDPSLLDEEEKSAEDRPLFVFVYLRAWFSAPLLESAASNDILFQSSQRFKRVNKKVYTITTRVPIELIFEKCEIMCELSLF